MTRNRVIALIGVVAAVALVAWLTSASVWQAIVAVAAAGIIFRIGYAMLSGLAQPVPEPPDPGELRKVKLAYRCSICGTEVRMTSAVDMDPEPPRHCMEDMDLLTPIE